MLTAMTILPVAATSVGDVLFKGQAISPELTEAEARLQRVQSQHDSYQARLQDTERLLGMPFLKRTSFTNMDQMRSGLWNEKRQIHVRLSPLTFCASALGGILAAPHLGLSGGGGVLLGIGLWLGYLKLMRHVALPLQVDHAAVKALRTERNQLQEALGPLKQAVDTARADLEAVRRDGLSRLSQAPSAQIAVEEASVTLGGVRVKVRKPG